jgi:hypothetical protein
VLTGILLIVPFQAYLPSNMQTGQMSVFQPGMGQVRPNVSAIPTPNSQALQNMQLQFQQQMNAALQHQQHQHQHQHQHQQHLQLQQQSMQHMGHAAAPINAQAAAVSQPWSLQAPAAQHGAFRAGGMESSGVAEAQLRRIGPGGSLGGAGPATALPAQSVSSCFSPGHPSLSDEGVRLQSLFPGSAAALAVAQARGGLDGRGGV